MQLVSLLKMIVMPGSGFRATSESTVQDGQDLIFLISLYFGICCLEMLIS